MGHVTVRRAVLIEHQLRLQSLGLELETHDGVYPLGPALRAPRLHDPLVGDKPPLPSRDAAPEAWEFPALLGVDLDGPTRDLFAFTCGPSAAGELICRRSETY